MDDYLSKPIIAAALKETLCRWFKIAPASATGPTGPVSDSPAIAAAVAPLSSRSPADPVVESTSQVLDFDTAFERMEGNVDLLRKLARSFCDNYGHEKVRIAEAIEKLDSKTIQMSAHTLRGTVGLFSASRSADAARRLETVARNHDWNEVKRVYAIFVAEIDLLLGELSGFCERAPLA